MSAIAMKVASGMAGLLVAGQPTVPTTLPPAPPCPPSQPQEVVELLAQPDRIAPGVHYRLPNRPDVFTIQGSQNGEFDQAQRLRTSLELARKASLSVPSEHCPADSVYSIVLPCSERSLDPMEPVRSGLPRNPGNKPRVAVVDEFRIASLDLNLDGMKDLPHGTVVQTLLQSLVDAEVVAFTNDEPVKILTRFIPEQLGRVSEAGDFDAVNISAGMHKSLRILAKKADIPNLSAENLEHYREKIRDYYVRTGEEEVAKVFDSIEKLTAAGVPVYLAGGNKGPDYVNLFGFARGAINLGAVNYEGQLAISSAQNSLLRYAQGVYSVAPVADPQLQGYDLDGSPPVEFTPQQISSGNSRVEIYRNQPLVDFLADAQDYSLKIGCDQEPFLCPIDKDDPLRDKLFDVGELARQGAITPAELQRLRAHHYDYASFDGRLHLRADDSGRLRFDPDSSGRDQAVGFIRGTSFASPTALAKDLNQKKAES